ncbi:coiled-coil domain-containing protein 63-like [Trachinotus anak]|uniref:coiled-coil domain-containing protein 63-like n=1 Tax=Trachinotus anak TaxID=443729 RepID=UPI0039F22C32
MATDIIEEEYNKVQEENDRYEQLNSQLKDRLVFLDQEIAVAERRIIEKLTVPGGIVKQQGKHRRHRKQIRILESKLHQDNIKFNKLMSINEAYRKEIAHLQQLKVTGSNIEKKLNTQLAIQQSTMEELERRLSVTFNQRSEAETQMQKMRESMEEETLDFIKRRMELRTAIHHDAKLHTFMETKLQEIVPFEEDADSKKRKKPLQYQNGAKKLEMYPQKEQGNIAYINYINELHNRRNTLRRLISKRKSDILFLEHKNKEHDEQSERELQELESELNKYRCMAASLEQQCTVVQKRLDQLKTAIASLYTEIMQTPITVTSDNVVHVIGVLEERIIDILIQANDIGNEELEVPRLRVPLGNYGLLSGGKKGSRKSCSSFA